MRIKAKANGNVIEADDEAARQLIEAGIYEKYDGEGEPKKSAEPAKRRKPQK